MEQLLAHVKAENAKTLAWIAEDPSNRWATTYSEDAADWEDRGITTLEELKRNELETFIYEVTKDTFGYRPSMEKYKSMTLEQLEAECESLSKSANDEFERECEREAEMFTRFEKRIADIQGVMNDMSKEDALRILIDSEGQAEDVKFYGYESLEYTLGIAYGSIKKWLEK